MPIYRGGCHCGAVVFEVDAPEPLAAATDCNCSICAAKGYLHWIVPKAAFRLIDGREALSTYRFNTGVARHHFCSECGIASFYVPRSDPDRVDVNVRCLRDVDLETLVVHKFDGRNWETAPKDWQHAERVSFPKG